MNRRFSDACISDIARDIHSGRSSATDLIAEACESHTRYSTILNAYRSWDGDNAKKIAENLSQQSRDVLSVKPLQGIPVSVKDLYGVVGSRTFAGSPHPLPPYWENEGPFISAFRQLGAVFVGRTHMVEFAFGGIGTNSHWPVPRNPWDMEVHRVPGGSSSGAGVSLIEGSAVVALGSDTAGSVRVPASVTGTVGFKPSVGRWPTKGMVPLSPTFDVPGLLSRSVADLAYIFRLVDRFFVQKSMITDMGAADLSATTIGRTDQHFWSDCSPGVVEAVDEAIQDLTPSAFKVISADLQGVEEAYSLFLDGGLAASEFRNFLNTQLSPWKATLDPRVAERIEVGPEYGSEAFNKRKQRFRDLATAANTVFSTVDVLIAPTVPLTAPTVAEVADNDSYAAANMKIVSNTCIANLLGLCALTIPVGRDALGIPVGMQLLCKAGNDCKLIELALAVEQKIGRAVDRIGHFVMTSPH